MKILAAQYGTELFGRERENIECYKSFQRLGCEVQVFGSYRTEHGGETGKLLSELGLKCGEMPFGSHFSLSYFLKMKGYWWLQMKRIFWCSNLMRKKAKNMGAHAIFIGGTMEFLYLWPFLFCQRRPIIYRVGDAPIWSSWFHKFIMKLLLQKAKLIIPVSNFIHSECIRLLQSTASKSFVIWNIPPEFNGNERTETKQFQTEGSCDEKYPTRFIYVGQITPEKGIRTMIDALAQLHTSLSWECRFVGGGLYTQHFQEEIKNYVKSIGLHDRVEFTGQVNDPSVHYLWADWHVLPSHLNEAFGLVIAEAKRHAVPSIVFPLGAMPELVENNVSGIITENETSESLAKAFHSAITGNLKMSHAALASYEKSFSTKRFDSDWRKVLTQVQKIKSSS